MHGEQMLQVLFDGPPGMVRSAMPCRTPGRQTEEILIFVVVQLSLRAARKISVPVAEIAEATERGGLIEPTHSSSVEVTELASLTARFNDFVRRIDEQKEGVEQNVEERTVLIREIHHRVKDNLQVIASLLSLQASEANDPIDERLFHQSRDRVVAIAMVHERLYASDDLSTIPFDVDTNRFPIRVRVLVVGSDHMYPWGSRCQMK